MKRNIKKSKQLHNCKTLKEIRRALNLLIRDIEKDNLKLSKEVVELSVENSKLRIRLSNANIIKSMLKQELAKARIPWWKKVLRWR